MADSVPLTGKAKKAKRDEVRQQSKKRKRHQDPVALPEGLDEPEDGAGDRAGVRTGEDTGEGARAEKSNKKAKRENHAKRQDVATDPTEPILVSSKGITSEDTQTKPTKQEETPKKQRFIVFVGNLPYTLSEEQLKQHFASIKPESIRFLTKPDTGQCKGYAFLEFAHFDRMKTCLKQFHHTIIDSGIGGERGKKKINVELTAGGGGSGAQRNQKLQTKNTRLEEERKRRAEALAKQEKKKRAKQAQSGASSTPPKPKVEKAAKPDASAGVHPARLARIQAD